ncbi:unnamed protein product [Bursaphelenchus okinawaensis]|uniref:Serine aminopeptidase S33 domain-containing protein n=1 Tax=Bursaphelenchus okinawaensis TaxID=465554 RepID=A0A811K0S3_9BILA|nr:unnamed protein product [Bursaphelenchus okinawaensis]CAG9088312.1 unnamed protein product [Bursaphelenchus okinawaensis]
MVENVSLLEITDRPSYNSSRPINLIDSKSRTDKPESILSMVERRKASDDDDSAKRPKPLPRTKKSVRSVYYPIHEPARKDYGYGTGSERLEFRSKTHGKISKSSEIAEDPTQDSLVTNYDTEQFEKVFGMHPRSLATGVLDATHGDLAEEFTQNETEKHSCACNRKVTVASESKKNRWNRFKNKLKNGLLLTAQYVASCCVICYVVTPPIPSLVTKKVAFHPPKGANYYFVIKKGDGEEIVTSAKFAYGQTILRIELELPRDFISSQGMDSPLEDIEGFVVKTSLNNYLAGVLVRCKVEVRPEEMKKKVIIFCQPNSSNLQCFMWRNHLFSVINFHDMAQLTGADVYAFDYSGFGMSTGTTLEKNVYADVRAVFEHVRKERIDCEIYIMGFSLGTAAAIDLAASQPAGLAGIILMAPFTSGMRVLCNTPLRDQRYVTDAFRSYEKAPSVDVPVLINHGVRDDVIPMSHGMSLLRKFHKPVPIELIEGRDHITIMRPLTAPVFLRITNFMMFEAPEYAAKFTKAQVVKDMEEKAEKIKADAQKSSLRQIRKSRRPKN